MKLIENLTSDANQTTHVLLDDGTTVDLTLIFRPAIGRWQFNIVHPRLTVYGKNICNHPNIIRQHKNTALFGLACVMSDGTEPTLITDFENARATLYILDETDIAEIEKDVFGMTGVTV